MRKVSAGKTELVADAADADGHKDDMSLATAYILLFVAAVLEAGGDALVRVGLHSSTLSNRLVLFLAGAVVLFAYGVAVNAPPWDFGKLLGVYVTLFFVVAQAINLIFFHVRPDPPILAGGALIVAGGLVITFWRP
jgi:small multidrug resistance family-3 protein